MSPRSASELVAYFRFTLQLIEQSPRRDEDEPARAELIRLLRHRIAEFERQMVSRPALSTFFRFLAWARTLNNREPIDTFGPIQDTGAGPRCTSLNWLSPRRTPRPPLSEMPVFTAHERTYDCPHLPQRSGYNQATTLLPPASTSFAEPPDLAAMGHLTHSPDSPQN